MPTAMSPTRRDHRVCSGPLPARHACVCHHLLCRRPRVPRSAGPGSHAGQRSARAGARAMPAEPLVSIEMFYAAGSAAEPDSLAGLARPCRASPLRGDEGRRRALAVSTPGPAGTARECLDFASGHDLESQCLPAFLPLLLELEAERMRGIHPDSLVFERERSVVLEEAAYRGWRRLRPTSPLFRPVSRPSLREGRHRHGRVHPADHPFCGPGAVLCAHHPASRSRPGHRRTDRPRRHAGPGARARFAAIPA